ncbi:Sodium-dependent phosphate transport protein 2B [Hondaea fermentalgiana]|uniref:Sodium-dependent phosphate transport protein 2B n=1 Tax=Hondaea fermentalgiana TaxID=2315210 RepID=A0A2R5GMW9_9STRA|nr:Sodium-dependent phosphate transport protein 2B [Hondaea fermentalgiana]|eukprot:GBG29651.1 Sodium-dependent phosphate transport protein 2B [Hondaea fermentalgiana]
MAFTPQGVAKGFGLFVGVLFFLYWFLVGLALLGDGFKVIAGDSAGTLFSAVSNPVAGLMVGILATVLVQSSSTTTSIIVAAAGAGVLKVSTGIPMVFGANIGTSVTNTIVSLGFVGDKEQYRRGFAGATVHDMFNYMNVCLWLPLEAISSAINGGNGGL